MTISQKYLSLLQTWCDRMIELQIDDKRQPWVDGGMLCPACRLVHGRVADSVYPMIYLYDYTGNQRYLDAAIKLFDFSANMLADDGSYYNDAQNDWNGITVFFASMLSRTLLHHGKCLPGDLKERMRERLKRNMTWIVNTIDDSFETNVNYQAAAAEAAALYGELMHDGSYLRYARERATLAMTYFSDHELLTGESHPRDYVSERGCRGVDIGYNLEESLPALLECVSILHDPQWHKALVSHIVAHTRFLLPDGGMDNSFGSRSYKWTYWGSRTSDGYLRMFEDAGLIEHRLWAYKYSAYKLFSACTHDGLIFGGPDYLTHDELPCIHHTICKAKAVAQLLDGDIHETESRPELEQGTVIRRYPEILTEQYVCGGFYMSVTVNDVFYQRGGHISGGTVGLLWHSATGPLLASGIMQYSLVEVTNMQLSLKKSEFGSMSLRWECHSDDNVYKSDQDFQASLFSRHTANGVMAVTHGVMRDLDGQGQHTYQLQYDIAHNSFTIVGTTSYSDAMLYVPLIGTSLMKRPDDTYTLVARNGVEVHVDVESGIVSGICQRFNLVGGFIAQELAIHPVNGRAVIRLSVPEH